jgi:hypothetical protein
VAQPDAIGLPEASQMKLLPCEHASAADIWDGHAEVALLQPELHAAVVGGPFVQPAATTAGHNDAQLDDGELEQA